MQESIGKRERLAALARHRRDNVFPGYRGIGEYHSGAYECDFVSPYTKSAGNLNADIMLVLQDWCSDEFLQKPVDSNLVTLGHDPKLPTNRNLKSLLSTHFGIGLEQTYTTNLFPFIKYGAMSKSVPVEDLEKAAETYTVPEIEIVEPRLVVCLGLAVYRAIRKSFGLAPAGNLEMAIASPFRIGDAQFWAQSSPGALGRANRNRGGVDRVAEDWRRMADAVQWDVSRGRPKHDASRDA
jgi:restriction system protein